MKEEFQDEKNQILTTNAWINQMWLDYNLQWNMSEFGNISTIHIPHQRIWRPDIVLYNKYDNTQSSYNILTLIGVCYCFSADAYYSSAIMSTDVFVNHGGNVTWLSSAIFKSSCQMNVRFYPFDDQVCIQLTI